MRLGYFQKKCPTSGHQVIWARFELTTDCLEGSCSIQLSYQTDGVQK